MKSAINGVNWQKIAKLDKNLRGKILDKIQINVSEHWKNCSFQEETSKYCCLKHTEPNEKATTLSSQKKHWKTVSSNKIIGHFGK